MPDGYATIVADPPWPSMHQRSTYHRGKPERHYSTMAVEDICALDVDGIAAPNAHLWVWGVNRMLEDAFKAVRAWGFTPMSILTWTKPGPGMGYYLRNNTEHCLFATRGKPVVPEQAAISSWWQWPRGSHSAKPDAFYDIVEQVSPGPYLEMFARRARLGWDTWGDQAPGGVDLISPASPLRSRRPVAIPTSRANGAQS
jgi:N6-adenosine-specific RNA methylase IME4